MGWDTYNAYSLDYNGSTVRTNAERLINLGFRDLGYNVVIFDDAMTERERASNGSLVENSEKFGNETGGLKGLVGELHGMGLKMGVYSSAGSCLSPFSAFSCFYLASSWLTNNPQANTRAANTPAA